MQALPDNRVQNQFNAKSIFLSSPFSVAHYQNLFCKLMLCIHLPPRRVIMEHNYSKRRPLSPAHFVKRQQRKTDDEQPCADSPDLPILMQVLLECDLRPGGLESRMFWGLRSLWIIPLACRTLMAPAICCRKTRMVSSLRVPLAVLVNK